MASYHKKCNICGSGFEASRDHAKTCSGTCRSILFFIKKNIKMLFGSDSERRVMDSLDFLKIHHSIKLFEPSAHKLRYLLGFWNEKVMMIVFRNQTTKCIEMWRGTRNKILAKSFAYGIQ